MKTPFPEVWDLWCRDAAEYPFDDPRAARIVKTTDGSFCPKLFGKSDLAFFDTLEKAQKYCEVLLVFDGVPLEGSSWELVGWSEECQGSEASLRRYFEELRSRLDQRRVMENDKRE